MKTTTKFIATAAAAVALFFSTATKAQDSQSWRLGFGVNAGLGTKDPFGFVLGGDVKLQKDLKGPVSVTLTTGFSHFFVKDEFDGLDAYNVIPVKAGAKVFAGKNLYLSGELGAGFSTDKDVKPSFLWSPTVGWAFSNGLDLGVKYEDYTRYSPAKQVALRLAYGFRLK